MAFDIGACAFVAEAHADMLPPPRRFCPPVGGESPTLASGCGVCVGGGPSHSNVFEQCGLGACAQQQSSIAAKQGTPYQDECLVAAMRRLEMLKALTVEIEETFAICAALRMEEASAARPKKLSWQAKPEFIAPSSWLWREMSGVQTNPPKEPDQVFDMIIRHNSGKCKPCLFWLHRCCKLGDECTHCHFQHPASAYRHIKLSKLTRKKFRMARNNQVGQAS